MSSSCSNDKREIVERSHLEGLHQLQNCFVADEDLRGRKILQFPRHCYVNRSLYSALGLCCVRLQPWKCVV